LPQPTDAFKLIATIRNRGTYMTVHKAWQTAAILMLAALGAQAGWQPIATSEDGVQTAIDPDRVERNADGAVQGWLLQSYPAERTMSDDAGKPVRYLSSAMLVQGQCEQKTLALLRAGLYAGKNGTGLEVYKLDEHAPGHAELAKPRPVNSGAAWARYALASLCVQAPGPDVTSLIDAVTTLGELDGPLPGDDAGWQAVPTPPSGDKIDIATRSLLRGSKPVAWFRIVPATPLALLGKGFSALGPAGSALIRYEADCSTQQLRVAQIALFAASTPAGKPLLRAPDLPPAAAMKRFDEGDTGKTMHALLCGPG
jgi:hypothetical protein